MRNNKKEKNLNHKLSTFNYQLSISSGGYDYFGAFELIDKKELETARENNNYKLVDAKITEHFNDIKKEIYNRMGYGHFYHEKYSKSKDEK